MAHARGGLVRRWGALFFILISIASGLHLAGSARAASPWLAPVRLSPPGSEAGHPTLAISADGLVHVLWEDRGHLWYAAGHGSAWSAPVQQLSGITPELVRAGDLLHLVYVNPVGTWRQIYYRTWHNGTWSIPRPLSSPGADCEQPRLAASPAGGLAVIWARSGSDWPVLYLATSADGLRTELPLMLGDTPTQGRFPVLAVDPAGTLHAAWEAPSDGEPATEVYHAWRAAQDWFGAFYVSDSPATPSTRPDAVADSVGNIHFVWQEGGPNAGEIYYVAQGQGASEGLAISSSQGQARAPRLAIDGGDNLHVVWDEGTALHYRRGSAAAQLWQPDETVATALEIRDAAVAVDAQGGVHVVWAAREPDGSLSIYYSQRAAGQPATATPLPPSATPELLPTVLPPSPTPGAEPYPPPRSQTPCFTPTASATPQPTPSPAATSEPTATHGPHKEGLCLPLIERVAPPVTPPPTVHAAVAAASAARLAGPSSVETAPTPVRLSDPAVSARNPAIAVSASGVVHVVWEQGEDLYHSYRQGDSWTPPVRVAAGESPSLAAAPDGSLHLAYVNEFGGNYDIFHVSWNGTRWSLPHNVSQTSSGVSSLPDITVGPDGQVHIVWTDTSPGYPVIYYGYGHLGPPFNTQQVPNARGSAPTVALTTDGAGHVAVHVAWQDRDDDTSPLEIYYSVLENGVWALAQNVSASPDADSRSPDLTAEGSELRLAWQEDGSSRTVRTVHGHSGWWPLPEPVSAGPAYLPAVASDGDITHLAWDTGTGIRLSQTWSTSTVWPTALTLAEGADEATDVAVAAGPGHEAHVVWAQRQGATWSIYYASHAFQPPFVCHLGLVMRAK